MYEDYTKRKYEQFSYANSTEVISKYSSSKSGCGRGCVPCSGCRNYS